jgi:hypothetical protein
MKAFIIAILSAMLTTVASAQNITQPCDSVYVAWGSDQLTVMKAAAKSDLSFNRVKSDEESGTTFVSYISGKYATMFTLQNGRYTTYSQVFYSGSSDERSKYLSEQSNTYVAMAKHVRGDGVIILDCDGDEISVRIAPSQNTVTLTITNETMFQQAVEEMVRSGR